MIVTIKDNEDYIRGGPLIFLFIFLLYHYYRVGGPPNISVLPPHSFFQIPRGSKRILGVLLRDGLENIFWDIPV